MRFKKFLVAALVVPKLCLAGGTLGTDELAFLMRQMPAVMEVIGASVDMSDSAYAQVRFGPHFKHLGGARMGPYTIQATSKKDGSTLLVVLCTKARFLSRTGQELPEARIEEAASIEEKLTGVMLRQEGGDVERPPC